MAYFFLVFSLKNFQFKHLVKYLKIFFLKAGTPKSLIANSNISLVNNFLLYSRNWKRVFVKSNADLILYFRFLFRNTLFLYFKIQTFSYQLIIRLHRMLGLQTSPRLKFSIQWSFHSHQKSFHYFLKNTNYFYFDQFF